MHPMTWEQAVLWLREQPDQQALVRDCFFDDPLIEAARRYHRSTEWQAMRRLLPSPAGTALDLGAGRGMTSYALARDGWKTVALEPDRSAVVGSRAIRRLAVEAGIEIRVGAAVGETLPFASETFDCVLGRQLLHHARDMSKLCREIGRILKKGAVFLATREHVISRQEDLGRFLESHPLHRHYGGENAYVLREYVTSIRAGGMDLVQVLNPFESDINLFPDTREGLKGRIARRIRLPWPGLIPNAILSFLGNRTRQPGRLYTFLGRKPHGE